MAWSTCTSLLVSTLLLVTVAPSSQARDPVRDNLLRELQNIHSTEEFLRNFVGIRRNFSAAAGEEEIIVRPGSLPGESTLFDLSTGSFRPGGIDEVAASTGDASDGCVPHPQAESLSSPEDDVNVLLWPPCADVMRCGGCCFQDGHHCVATATATRIVPVVRARYPYAGAPNFEFDGLYDKEVVDETACVCQCRVQEHHCDPVIHYYDFNACMCRCRDNQATTCQRPQMWNPARCECMCPEVKHCEVFGEMFNFETCSCDVPSIPIEVEIPCTLRCRPGFRATVVGGLCACRVVTDW